MWILNDVEPLTWRDWVNVPAPVAIVNFTVYNRSYTHSRLLIAVAGKNRQPLQTPTGLVAERVGPHLDGDATYSYRVSAIDHTGETLVSEAVTIDYCWPVFNPTNYVRLTWDAVPGAVGYKIYGRKEGAEVLLAVVYGTTQYEDKMADYLGDSPPVYNTTQLRARVFDGILEARHILKSQEKLILDETEKLIVLTDGTNFEFSAAGVEV